MKTKKQPRKPSKKPNIDRFWVIVIEDATGEPVREMGPMSEHKADKVSDGVSGTLNHDRFSVKIEERP